MKKSLLATISIAVFMAGIVTLNLNSAVWAKDDNKDDSTNSLRISENTNGNVNTKSDDNGNTHNMNSVQRQIGGDQSANNCLSDPKCQKTLDDAMGMLNDIMKPNFP